MDHSGTETLSGIRFTGPSMIKVLSPGLSADGLMGDAEIKMR